jgi:CheY-like chemotaxis protein
MAFPMSGRSAQSHPLKILLAEDDDGDARALQRAFARANINVSLIRATDGLDALHIMRGEGGLRRIEPPFIVLTDLNMPRMDGIELLRSMRADPRLRKYVVFLLTTSNREEDRMRAYNLNVCGYLVKNKMGENSAELTSLLLTYWNNVELPC